MNTHSRRSSPEPVSSRYRANVANRDIPSGFEPTNREMEEAARRTSFESAANNQHHDIDFTNPAELAKLRNPQALAKVLLDPKAMEQIKSSPEGMAAFVNFAGVQTGLKALMADKKLGSDPEIAKVLDGIKGGLTGEDITVKNARTSMEALMAPQSPEGHVAGLSGTGPTNRGYPGVDTYPGQKPKDAEQRVARLPSPSMGSGFV